MNCTPISVSKTTSVIEAHFGGEISACCLMPLTPTQVEGRLVDGCDNCGTFPGVWA